MRRLILAAVAAATLIGFGSQAHAEPAGGVPVVGATGIVANMVKCASNVQATLGSKLVTYSPTGTKGFYLADLDGYVDIQTGYNNCLIEMFEAFNIGCIPTVGKGVELCHAFDENIAQRKAENANLAAFRSSSGVYHITPSATGIGETVVVGSPRDNVIRASGIADSATIAAYLAD